MGSQATAEALLLVLTVLGRATSLEYLPSAPRCTTPLAVATPLRKAWERSQELTAPVAPCGGNTFEPTTVFQFFSKKKIKKTCGGSQAKQFLFNELVFLGSRQNPPRRTPRATLSQRSYSHLSILPDSALAGRTAQEISFYITLAFPPNSKLVCHVLCFERARERLCPHLQLLLRSRLELPPQTHAHGAFAQCSVSRRLDWDLGGAGHTLATC